MGRKKRTKSQTSPDSVSTSQEKRPALVDLSSKIAHNSQIMSSFQQQSQGIILPQYRLV